MELISSKIRILIADDNARVRSSVRAILEGHDGWMVCSEAADGPEAVEKTIQLQPNVVVVDVSMPGLSGVAVAASIRRNVPDTKVLLLAEHDLVVLKALASQAGAGGYVAKSRMMDDLIPAVEALAVVSSCNDPV